MIGHVESFADADSVASHAADWLIARVAAAEAPVRVALSGGSTPKRLFSLLAQPERAARMKWERLALFWGDERCVHYDSPDSNYGEAKRLLLDHVPIDMGQVHPFPTNLAPEEAAARYAQTLQAAYGATVLAPSKPLFEVNFLGLGEDGHTASLIPGQPVLDELRAWTAAVAGGRPEVRLTLTYPALESADTVVFLVCGASKAAIFAELQAGTADVPAARLRPQGETIWFVDQAALGG
jgi:6-phosphogluconolactonase